jgi:hypothetical protein
MDINRPGLKPSLALPEIVFNDSNSDRYRTSSRSSSYNSSSSTSSHAIPMPIKGSREPPPPPLPPPKDLADIRTGGNNGQDLAWRFANSHGDMDSLGSSVAPGSSLYGGSFSTRKSKNTKEHDRPDYSRRTSSSTTIKSTQPGDSEHALPRDEGYWSYSTGIGSHRLVNLLIKFSFHICRREAILGCFVIERPPSPSSLSRTNAFMLF